MRHRKPSTGRHRDERGATVVLLGLVLVVLMIFAAFSVDIGTAYAQKRQNQGTVDTAALAGGVHFITNGSFSDTIKDVKARVADDMGTKISEADWAACKDPDALPKSSLAYSPSQGSECISFLQDPDTNVIKMRVRLPDVSNATAFAGVIGIDSLKTHAVAEIDITPPIPMVPTYVLSGVEAGNVSCIISDPNGQNQPCTGQVGGQFGAFDPFYYFSNPVCQSAFTNVGTGWSSVAPAIAKGMDHQLMPMPKSVYDAGAVPERRNGGNTCAVLGPNTVRNVNGNTNAVTVSAGLVNGQNGTAPVYTGRLVGGPYVGDGTEFYQAVMAGKEIDNAPLWHFLVDPLPANAPLTCQVAAQFDVKRDVLQAQTLAWNAGLVDQNGNLYTNPEDVMARCLGDWTTDVGQLFTTDYAKSRRAVNVPRYHETAENSTGWYHIRDFVPTFLAGEFQSVSSCMGSYGVPNDSEQCRDAIAADKDVTHWAGDPITTSSAWNPSNPNKLLDGAAGFFIPCGAMPETICQPDPNDPEGFGGVVQVVKLIK